ncbi:MAG: 1-(5-phosphoribosyl)-5-[(5-phosphoribosylamino)methylideneamino]imidazole-4-carboxamide isomerase [Proteobacteria bacterium]|nr:1-(5-phosphoribosyl)-5-[(5-phosphoribosylamino)methylideneamino]imidazole-4-carboxamide isomerase [Pseudomonadota bacterium]
MILFPAIDLKDGACVRLVRGDMEQAVVFNADPAAQAKAFEAMGFEALHLVDLNGAFEGKPINAGAVESVLKAIKMPVQLGGGIRNMETIELWLGKGVKRVILGTAALQKPLLVHEACKKFPGQVAIAIDAREGYVAVSGWAENTRVKALDLALRFEDAGAAAIIYTDISRDGALTGLNVEGTSDLAYALTTPVIASGGVSSLQDLIELKREEESGIIGVISGRALYDGRLPVKEALEILKGAKGLGG